MPDEPDAANREETAPAITPGHALRVGLRTAVFLVVVDQVSKWWIVYNVMRPPQKFEITSFFDIVMVWNRGVSFGFCGDCGPAVLTGLAAVITVALLIWVWRSDTWLQACALGLIIGGAVGNGIDRLRFGAVADFLHFHWGENYFPAFNVADAAISVGVVLLLIDALFMGARSSNK